MKIEKNIPMPTSTRIPLELLKVGESVLFPAEDRSRVQSTASQWKRKTGQEFTVKKVSDTQCRIWRIA